MAISRLLSSFDDMPPLLRFRGRVARRHYLVLQLASVTFLGVGLTALFGSVSSPELAACPVGGTQLLVRGWMLGLALGALLCSMWIGAAAVTRRARDAGLPASFVGALYLLNRMNLPITTGLVGPSHVRDMALVLSAIMFALQVLLVARDTVRPGREAAATG